MSDPAAPTWKGSLIALLVGVVLMVVMAEGVLRVLMPNWKEYYPGHFMEQVSVPGHASLAMGKPGFEGFFSQNNGDFRHSVKINGLGLRNDEPIEAAGGRVWVIGDSMAFGWGVERDQNYTGVIARQLETPTYNLASPGTDVCGYQALAARVPDGIRPTAVVVGLILENDIQDYDCAAKSRKEQAAAQKKPVETSYSLLFFKTLLTRESALYNFLAVQLKRQAWMSDALIALGLLERPHKLRNTFPDNQLGPRTRATAREVQRLRDSFPAVPFAVLVAPARFEIRDDQSFYRKLRLEMTAAMENLGLVVIDPLPGFKEAGFKATHFLHDGHWSPLGHQVAGQAAAEWLRRQGLGR